MWYNRLLSSGLIPDNLIRCRIKQLTKKRLIDEMSKNDFAALVEELKKSPLAIHTNDANEQHYELPTSFFQLVLGDYLKYSCGWWESGAATLSESERDMLLLTCKRAELQNGQQVLELGCGWGSLSLFMAQHYPESHFTVLSNSSTQKQYIDSKITELGLQNLEVITCDINDFDTDKKFDRVVSVEMFEHLRNYELLFLKISNWLLNSGKLFVHVFSHRIYAYKFEVKDSSDWMSKYFFRGGLMPSHNLFSYFNAHLVIEKDWKVNGKNYSKTAKEWLNRATEKRETIMPIIESAYGMESAKLRYQYWRIFFMTCEEFFGYNDGNEWGISHYLLRKNK